MKTPIWKVATRQATRILRYGEIKEILSNIEVEPSGSWSRRIPASKGNVQIWLQGLLFTGMRFYELFILHSHPELLQDDGTLRLDKNLFYDVGKQKQTVKERIVYLSDMGIGVVDKFFKTLPLHSDPKEAYRYLDSVLAATGKKLGYPERTITYKENKTIGIQEIEKDGKRKIVRQTAPIDRVISTNGLSLRVFRKTWNSWLVNYFKNDNHSLTIAEMSMGHTDKTALKHYLTLQFDDEDMKEIEKAVKGFGLHPGWRNEKEMPEEDKSPQTQQTA